MTTNTPEPAATPITDGFVMSKYVSKDALYEAMRESHRQLESALQAERERAEMEKRGRELMTRNAYDWKDAAEKAEAERDKLRAEHAALKEQVEADRRDAERFRKLQDMPITTAQSFFWNYKSRKERAKAIDRARSQP